MYITNEEDIVITDLLRMMDKLSILEEEDVDLYLEDSHFFTEWT